MENKYNKYEEYLNKISMSKNTMRQNTKFTCSKEIFLLDAINYENDNFKIIVDKKFITNDYNEDVVEYNIQINKKKEFDDSLFFTSIGEENMVGMLYFILASINRYIKYQITYKYPSCFIYFIFMDIKSQKDIDTLDKILKNQNILEIEQKIIHFSLKFYGTYYFFTYIKNSINNVVVIPKIYENTTEKNHQLSKIFDLLTNIFEFQTYIFPSNQSYLSLINEFLKEKNADRKTVHPKNFNSCFNTLMNYDLKPKNIYFSDPFIIADNQNNSIVKYIKKIKS